MIKLVNGGVYLHNGREAWTDTAELRAKYGNVPSAEEARRGTIAYGIIETHNSGEGDALRLRFDAMASHDITYVSVIQTAKASGLTKFPVPYVLTNCHNSLCAVGGTINEDDHRFGLSAARKYGGIYVPPHIAVIHQYMREAFAGCGKMIIGTDSHTRYGAIGTMAIGEGGGEIVKQLLCKTYDVRRPGVVAVRLSGKPAPGVGAQDVALAIIGATFKNAFVKNKVMEFVGEGVAHLSMDFRNGVDVMTTETSCLSSIWETDGKTKAYLEKHGRAGDYKKLSPAEWAYYDAMIDVDLSKVRPMIALPFHPSNTFAIEELRENAGDILRKVETDAVQSVGREIKLTDKITARGIKTDQGVIAGCAGGTFENIMFANTLLTGRSTGCGEFALSVYPASQPILLELMAQGAAADLVKAGATLRTAFCGPCFGAGDVPFNDALSVRHTTRNFPHREGSRPGDGQMASVALMDARSIAATAANGGIITPATDFDCDYALPEYDFDNSAYESRVYNGWGKALPEEALAYGPNIVDWPSIPAMEEDLLLKVVSYIDDPVTTTDELIPSGETSSYRSNPMRLAEYTLSRKDPGYVGRAKVVLEAEKARRDGRDPAAALEELEAAYGEIAKLSGSADRAKIGLGSVIYAVKPGDGSAREQAASCQRVLGGSANIAREYATKRYRSNLINWGMVPFTMAEMPQFEAGDYIYIPGIRRVIAEGGTSARGYVLGRGAELRLETGELTGAERRILLAGCLMNDYRGRVTE